MSSLLDHVINYCERTDASFWSEPINALSNIAFLIAAYLAYTAYQRAAVKNRPIMILIIMTGIVGIGSFIFHTFATKLAMLFDVIPIVAFVAYYIYVSFTRLLQWKTLHAILLVVAFVVIGSQMDGMAPPYNLNGSAAYLPCLAILVYIGWKLCARSHPAQSIFRLAALCFAISLTFRTIDMQICHTLHTGTHFLWHCCNGLVLYLLIKALIQSAKPAN